MARPARARPRPHSTTPVRAELNASATSVAVSRPLSAPFAAMWPVSAVTSAAVTADVEPSGPPIANGSELYIDTAAPPTAPVMKVAAMP